MPNREHAGHSGHTVMGGYNSGRHGGPLTMEGTDSIRIGMSAVVPARGRPPPPGMCFSGTRRGFPYRIVVIATLDSPDIGRGTLRIMHDSIRHPSGSETGRQDYTIKMLDAPCTLGGRRWLFLCPRTGRRCRTLVLPNGGDRFLSRQGYQLGYHSQRIKGVDVCNARLACIHRKLGIDYGGPGGRRPRRPKGVRRRTYDKVLDEIAEAERLLDIAFIAGAMRLLGQSWD